MDLDKIFKEIELERRKQNSKWGGYEHDDTHSGHDWISYIVKHLGKSLSNNPFQFDERNFRKQMIRVAALAIAAIESIDRNYTYCNSSLDK